MKNSEDVLQLENVLDRIFGLLNNERITLEIVKPLEYAINSFQLEIKTPISYKVFNQVIAEFIRHIFRNGICQKRDLSLDKSLSKAISILNRHYHLGYDGALIDALYDQFGGVELVLHRVGEAVKEIEREQYVRSVFLNNIDWSDWQIKKKLVEIFLKKYRKILPIQLRDKKPESLVKSLTDLIDSYL